MGVIFHFRKPPKTDVFGTHRHLSGYATAKTLPTFPHGNNGFFERLCHIGVFGRSSKPKGFRISNLTSPSCILLPEPPVGVALSRMLTGRAVSDDFGSTEDCCERMPLAQISSEGALTGNAAPKNRGVQAGRPVPERTFACQMAAWPAFGHGDGDGHGSGTGREGMSNPSSVPRSL